MTKPQGVLPPTEAVPSSPPRAMGEAAERGAMPTSHDGSAVAIVDDDPGVLRSLARLLTVHGFEVRAFSSPESLLAELNSFSPACVIADLSMPGLTGLDLQRKLEESSLTYPIVFVTAYGDIRTSVLAMRSGAVDFLTKPFDQGDLLAAVDRAIALSSHSREQANRLATVRQNVASLTERETEVFRQVVAGLLNKQIAADLGISEKTVKVHRARVMRKMGVRSVAQLARAAEQLRTDVGDRAAGNRSAAW